MCGWEMMERRRPCLPRGLEWGGGTHAQHSHLPGERWGLEKEGGLQCVKATASWVLCPSWMYMYMAGSPGAWCGRLDLFLAEVRATYIMYRPISHHPYLREQGTRILHGMDTFYLKSPQSRLPSTSGHLLLLTCKRTAVPFPTIAVRFHCMPVLRKRINSAEMVFRRPRAASRRRKPWV